MNIYAPKGTKVSFSYPENGNSFQQQEIKKYLTPNSIYTVDWTVVEDWHTRVYLQEFPGVPFNSVFFEEV